MKWYLLFAWWGIAFLIYTFAVSVDSFSSNLLVVFALVAASFVVFGASLGYLLAEHHLKKTAPAVTTNKKPAVSAAKR